MTKDEALKLALDWYDSGAEHRDEFQVMIEAILAQPAQEPQVRTGNCLLCGVCASEGHKIQAKRPWVGLTEKEMQDAHSYAAKNCPSHDSVQCFADAIEAILKEKNNG